MRKVGLSTAHGEQHYLTFKKYYILVKTIWECDWHDYEHGASRVGFSAKLNCFCFSSARLGELTESLARIATGKGLRYRVSISSRVSTSLRKVRKDLFELTILDRI
jgi:hypothetical protein